MTTENKEMNLDEMVAKISAEVTSKVSSQVAGVDYKLSSFEKKLDSFKPTQVEEEADDQDDELVVSKKDVKKMFAELTETIDKKITGTVSESLNVSTKKNQWDAKTENDFPMLVTKNPFFSKDFQKDVQEEMSERVKDGGSYEDPRLVYDSAASVYARKPKYQQLRKEHLDEEVRRANNRDGQFNLRGGRKEQSQELSSTQMDLAKRFGLDPAKVVERMKKTGN
jgi:hypothetical protein